MPDRNGAALLFEIHIENNAGKTNTSIVV